MSTTDAIKTRPPAHRLDALEAALSSAGSDRAEVAIAGSVTEVTPAYCRVGGLSPFVKLGECVGARIEWALAAVRGRSHRRGGVTVKPFEATLRAGLGTIAWRRGFVTIDPHISWKGRTVNALGAAVDGGGPLQQGELRYRPSASRRRRCAASASARP
jgi:flagellum-specific ATP synthase